MVFDKKQWYLDNHDRIRAHYKETYQKNRLKETARKRKYFRENREERLAHDRQYYQKHREEILERQREYYKKNKPKRSAKAQAYHKTPLDIKCEVCGSSQNLERHHRDYSKPLEVVTLCRSCHTQLHHGTGTLTLFLEASA